MKYIIHLVKLDSNRKFKTHGFVKFDNDKKKIKWIFKINMVLGMNQHVKAKMKFWEKKANHWKKRKANLDINFKGDGTAGVGRLAKTSSSTGCECKDFINVPESPSGSEHEKKLKVKHSLVNFGVGVIERDKLVRLNRDDVDFHVEYIWNGLVKKDLDPASEPAFPCTE